MLYIENGPRVTNCCLTLPGWPG